VKKARKREEERGEGRATAGVIAICSVQSKKSGGGASIARDDWGGGR